MAKGLRLQAKLQWDSPTHLLDILLYPPKRLVIRK